MAITDFLADQEGEGHERMMALELIQKIALSGDGRALHELFARPLFETANKRIPLPSFLDHLRQQALDRTMWKHLPEEVDDAYDLTLDKLYGRSDEAGTSEKSLLRASPACRGYYRAFLSFAGPKLSAHDSLLEQESHCLALFQGFVKRQFRYSCREAARRALPFMSRFNWSVRGRSLCLYMPITMRGKERPRWLEENIPNPEPDRAGERERVQAIIDRRLVFGSFVPICDVEYRLGASAPSFDPAVSALRNDLAEKGLAEIVASEKSQRIGEQRPGIMKLGSERLYALVHRILDAVEANVCNGAEIAAEYGISQATLSRFAGKRWDGESNSGRGRVPDLWKNMASILACVPEFAEVAKEAGVWPRIAAIAKPPTGEGSKD